MSACPIVTLYEIIHIGTSDQILIELYDKEGNLADLSATTRGTLELANILVDSDDDPMLWNWNIGAGKLEILPGADAAIAAMTTEWEGYVTLRLYESSYPNGRTWLSNCTSYRLKVKLCEA